MDVVAPVGWGEPQELASSVRADGAGKRRMLHLFGERESDLAIELFWPVNGEAVGGPAEQKAEHCNSGRVRPEVGMDVVDRTFFGELTEAGSFGDICRPVGGRFLRITGEVHRSGRCRTQALRVLEALGLQLSLIHI